MQNRIRLISGRVPTTNSSNLASDRYEYLDLASAEPNLGTSIDGNILSYDSSILGGRKWITQQSITQPSFNVANSASANTIITQGVDDTQNTRINSIETINSQQNTNIVSVNQFAASAYNSANTNATNLTYLNSYAESAYAKANTNALDIISVNQYAASGYDLANTNAINLSSNVGLQFDINATQNTRLDSIETINTNQNNAITIIQGVDETQNTRLDSIETVNTNQNNAITIIQGVDDTQNTQIAGLQGVDLAQNTAISIIQGVDETQNTRIGYIEAVNTNQNTAISIIQGVDLGQNATITAVNQFAQSAYDTANTKLNSSGGTITGSLNINNDLTISGNLSVLGNTFAVSANTLEVKDSLITLGVGNYISDIIDIGFAGHYNDGTNAHTGLIRDAGNKEWYLFQGYTPIINGNNNIDINNSSFQTSNLNAGFVKGNLIGTTVSVNGLDVTSVFNTQNNTTIAVNQYAGAAYAQANVTVGVDVTQNTRLDSIETINVNQNTSISIIQGVDVTQNTQIQGLQGVDLTQNSAISIIQGVDLGQNATITAVNQFTQSAYDTANGANGLASGAYNQANVTIGVDATQNTRLDSIETININQNNAISIIQGVDETQNTRIGSIEIVNTDQNTAISIIQGVDLGQNATITAVNQFATSAYDQANVTIGVDATQNTRLNSIETINVNQNNSISIIQGVDLTQNTRLNAIETINTNQNTSISIIQGVDLTQNTRLDSIETINTNQNTAIGIIQGVDLGQNATITAVNQFAQSAYNTANGANGLAAGAFDTANTKFNSSGGTISGSVTISANNNLTVTGNLTVLGTSTIVNTESFTVNDPMIILALGNYTTDAVDIGFAGHYNDGTNAHAGLIRDYASKDWYLFQGYTPEVTGNNNIDINHASFSTANLNARFIRGNVVAKTAVINGIDFTDSQATQNTRLNSIETINIDQNTSITQVNQYAASAYNQANTNLGNISIIQGIDLTQNTRLNSIETINTNQNNTITAVNQFTQSAYDTANNKLDLSGGVVHGDITANNLTANVAVISPELRSTGGTTHVYTSDIGIVAIDVGGGQTKFYNAGVEVPGDVYAGTFGGNRVSLGGNEAKLQSIRTATVQIQTGTDGSVSNTWTFNGNKLTFPDNSVQNTAFTGVALDQFVRDVANSASANTIVTQGVDTWQNNAILVLQNSLITINANSAFSSAVDATQNTRLDSIETINTNQNTAISIIQGVDLWQNTQITYVNQFAQAAFDAANSSVSSGIDFYARDTANSAVLVNNNQNTAISIIQGVDLGQNATITAVNQFAQSAFNTANGANGLAAGAFNTANGANGLAAGAFNKANNALPLTGGTLTGPLVISNNNDLTVTGNLYILGNTTSISANTLEVKDSMIMLGIGNYTTDIVDIGFAGHYNAGTNAHAGLIRDAGNKEWYLFQGYTPALGGNNNINIADASFSTSNLNASYVKGNLIATTVSVNGVDVTSVFNTQNTAISIMQGVDLGQNATIIAVNQFAQSAYDKANAALTTSIDQYARNTANGANGLAAGAFNQANTTAGGLLTANSNISIIQGVDLTQNTRLNAIETINTNQNTSISIIQGVDLGQNATITAVNQFTQSAFNQANTANTRAFNTVLKSGDTMTGALNITSALVGTTWGNGALNINGNIVGNNAIYFGGTAAFGTANGSNKFSNALISGIGNSTSYAQAVLQNGNSGVGSSTDFVATADNGTDADTFIDMGINSSSYNQAGFELTGPNDGYLYVYGNTATGGGNLVLSTFTPKDIVFSLNGQGVGNEYARFQYNTGLKLKNLPLTFADNTSQNTAYNPGIDATQNTQISVIQGVDATQNTRLNSIETINTNQNTTISIIQGVDLGQNTTISIIQGVDVTQNTRLNSIETINTNQNTTISIIQGVDLGQNATITAVNQFAQSAYNKANTGTSVTYSANSVIFANSAGFLSNTSNLQFFTSNNTLVINGTLAATSKSFSIPHPTKEGKQLRYGSLEGPENGVYVRGRLLNSNIIELPEYWTKLIDLDTITVNLTPVGNHQKLFVEKIENNCVYVGQEGWFKNDINCFYVVYAERSDIEKLVVES